LANILLPPAGIALHQKHTDMQNPTTSDGIFDSVISHKFQLRITYFINRKHSNQYSGHNRSHQGHYQSLTKHH